MRDRRICENKGIQTKDLRPKQSHADIMHNLPASAKIVLDAIRDQPATPKSITAITNLAGRTVSHALRKLLSAGLVRRLPNLEDMRQPYYTVGDDKREWKTNYSHDKDTVALPEWSERDALAHLLDPEDMARILTGVLSESPK